MVLVIFALGYILIWKWSVTIPCTMRRLYYLAEFCIAAAAGNFFCKALVRNIILPSAEWISEWIEMFWSKWFFRIQKTCPFLSCIWPLKSFPLSSFASLPWLLTQLRVCKQSPIQSIWHVLLPMRPGYLGGLQSLQLPWNDIMNSVRLKCQTKIQITLKCICDHCQFEAVDTVERLSSLYMSVHWWSEHVITVAELSLSMHRCRPTIATFTSWCLDQQGLHMKVPLPLGNLQRLVVLFTSHDIVFFIHPANATRTLVLHSLLSEKSTTSDLVVGCCRALLKCNQRIVLDAGGNYRMELFLPEGYPMEPPKAIGVKNLSLLAFWKLSFLQVRFLTKIYHPNIAGDPSILKNVARYDGAWISSFARVPEDKLGRICLDVLKEQTLEGWTSNETISQS